MRHLRSVAAAVLLAYCPEPAPADPNLPAGASAATGPGAVIAAVQALLSAQGAHDRAAIAKALDTTGDHLYGFDLTAAGTSKERSFDEPMAFFDVDPSGRARAATTAAGAVDLLVACASRRTLRTIRANCHSAQCSVATCEFDCAAGTGDPPRRMRATALLRYDAELPGFRIFHWHASPSAEAAAPPIPR